MFVGVMLGCWTFCASSLAAAPEVTSHGASEWSQTGVTIEAAINTEGGATTYEIALECLYVGEIGPCEPVSGAATVDNGVIPAGLEAQTVTGAFNHLEPGSEYKYRIVATSSGRRGGWVGSGFSTCPATGACFTMQPWRPGDELWVFEGERKEGEEAPRLEAEREAKLKEEEEKPVREAAERAAKERELREAGERIGRETGERIGKEQAERAAAASAKAMKCIVPPLQGDSLARARKALERAHCRLGKVNAPRTRHGTLVVRAQGVPSGRALTKGAKVAITLRQRRTHG